MHEIIDELLKSTLEYERLFSKEIRKQNSQFFTPLEIAKYMSDLFSYNKKNEIRILDPAGGTGILSLILLQRLLKVGSIKRIILDIYEIDSVIFQVLKANIGLISNEYRKSNIKLIINLFNTNFITSEKKYKYDLIIGNPPYKKINKNTGEAQVIKELLYGQPNLYMIFLALSLNLLNDNGELVFVVPRSFFNGKYFTKFRKWVYKNFSIVFIHSFESRSKIINDEVLQELVIIKIIKDQVEEVKINHSKNEQDIRNNSFIVKRDFIWGTGSSKNIRLPISNSDIELLRVFDSMSQTINSLDLTFKTGPVVDFRIKQGLYSMEHHECVPLIWCANFGKGYVKWPHNLAKYKQYISSKYNKNVLLPNGNYILIKRFSGKEEGNSLKLSVITEDLLNYDYIGIENHVNYVFFNDEKKEIMKGIYIVLNSNFYNRYFKIINGTTQINATDLNALPIFPYEILKKISDCHLKYDELTNEVCNNIIRRYLDKK